MEKASTTTLSSRAILPCTPPKKTWVEWKPFSKFACQETCFAFSSRRRPKSMLSREKAIGKEKKNRCRSRAWLRFARHKEQGKPTGISATGATAPFTLGHPCWMMDALILQPFQKLQRLGTRPRDLEAK